MGSRPAESAGGRSFRLALLLRAALLVGALAAVAVAWAAPGYHAVTLLFVLVSAVSTAELVSFVSSFTTLLPGDVILTGTPEGVGRIEPGDVVDVEIEGIGTLTNPVVAAE